jgi:co-chaperonin GroES (HSP10)
VGLILSMGSDAYADKNKFPNGPWCKKGDWVVFAKYAGSRVKIEGGEIRILNDDEILAKLKDPKDVLTIY